MTTKPTEYEAPSSDEPQDTFPEQEAQLSREYQRLKREILALRASKPSDAVIEGIRTLCFRLIEIHHELRRLREADLVKFEGELNLADIGLQALITGSGKLMHNPARQSAPELDRRGSRDGFAGVGPPTPRSPISEKWQRVFQIVKQSGIDEKIQSVAAVYVLYYCFE